VRTSPEHTTLELIVIEASMATPDIRSLILARIDRGPLPGWTPGAHVKLELPDGGLRSYSLINAAGSRTAMAEPHEYRLGVKLEANGKGGSRFMHSLEVGDRVKAGAPQNNFSLRSGARKVVLLAGGIGITPLLSMAASLCAEDAEFEFIYAGRSRAHLAFLPELETLCGSRLTVHSDAESGILEIGRVAASVDAQDLLYVCGPMPMIDAAIAYARDHDWPDGKLNFEIFAEPAPVAGDQAFDVVLANSGQRIRVKADQSILHALIEAGVEMIYDCQRGDCGMCQVRVLEGLPDHRDHYLSEAERRSNTVIQACVSRSKSPVLVLDLP
jgi:ferredoxin-NADP reductase